MKLSVAVCVMTWLLAADARADIFSDHPQNQTFTLENGRTVAFPLHLYDYDQLMLTGVADRAAAQAEIAETGLFVGPLTDAVGNVLSESLTGVAIFIIKYNDTSLGDYNETIVTIPVADTTGRWGYYVLSMHVTERLAQRVGIEALGLPKKLGVIGMTTPATKTWAFGYADIFGAVSAGSCKDCGALPAFPSALDFLSATTDPESGQVKWFRVITETDAASARPYDSAQDHFWSNPQTPEGAILQRIGFSLPPGAMWFVSRGVRGITFLPQ